MKKGKNCFTLFKTICFTFLFTLLLGTMISSTDVYAASSDSSIANTRYIQPREMLTYEVDTLTANELITIATTITVRDFGTSKQIISVGSSRVTSWYSEVDDGSIQILDGEIRNNGKYAVIDVLYKSGGDTQLTHAYVYP